MPLLSANGAVLLEFFIAFHTKKITIRAQNDTINKRTSHLN